MDWEKRGIVVPTIPLFSNGWFGGGSAVNDIIHKGIQDVSSWVTSTIPGHGKILDCQEMSQVGEKYGKIPVFLKRGKNRAGVAGEF